MLKQKDLEKTTDSLASFLNQFGKNDVYTQIIVEELLKYLMENKKDKNVSTTKWFIYLFVKKR